MMPSWIKNWIVVPAVLIGGIFVGVLLPIQQIRNSVATIFDLSDEEKKDDEQNEADAGLHVDISETAQDSLGLIVRRANLGHYTPTYDIPATVRTLPGAESIRLSSRYSGLVKKVFVSEGQSVRAGDPLLEIELTGEKLSRAQSELLLAIRKNKNLTEELKRLEPLVQQGGLANKRYLELFYEQKQLVADIDTRQQELLLLGLSEAQVKSILTDKKLIREVVVRVPHDLLPPQLNLKWDKIAAKKHSFIVESLIAKPGTMVQSGSDIGVMAFHEILIVEGHSFERDLETIRMLVKNKSRVSANVGKSSSEDRIKGCEIAYIGNHAIGSTNTYPFYVYLRNKLVNAPIDSPTPQYFSWKWKPGQLGHLELPKGAYENMLILPRAAIAEDGISRLVFEWKGQVAHEHEEEEEDHEHADEFVPIEVNVVFMDSEFAVVDPQGNLKEGTKIAFNCANQLLFAMQSGSGGHGHTHPHPH